VYFLTRCCGLIFIALAGIALILSIMDTVPEALAASETLRQGDNPLPIATSVKYKIGSEVLTDVLAIAVFAFMGWFLWASEIQQTWAVVLTFLLLVGSIAIRVEPLVPLDVARISPGLVFWGAKIEENLYPSPLKPGSKIRRVSTFPVKQTNALAVTKPNLSGTSPHPSLSVVLDFEPARATAAQFGPAGARITGKLAGTRTVLDWDHEKVVYAVPHLPVTQVQPAGTGMVQSGAGGVGQ